MPFDMHLILQIAIQSAEAEKGAPVYLIEIFRAISKNVEIMEVDDLASVLSRMVRNDEVFINQEMTLFSLNPVKEENYEGSKFLMFSGHLTRLYD